MIRLLTESVDNDCGDNSKLRAVRKLQGCRHVQRRVGFVQVLIEQAIGSDDRRNIVRQAHVVECSRGRDGQVSREQNVLDWRLPSMTGVRPDEAANSQYMMGAITQ